MRDEEDRDETFEGICTFIASAPLADARRLYAETITVLAETIGRVHHVRFADLSSEGREERAAVLARMTQHRLNVITAWLARAEREAA